MQRMRKKELVPALSQSLMFLRYRHRLTQIFIAQSLSINRYAYSFYESGKSEPSLEGLAAIASFYSVSTDMLLGLKPLRLKSQLQLQFLDKDIKDAPACLFCYMLRLFRLKSELTAQKLCGLLHLDEEDYAEYESGKKEPSLEKLVQIARFFDVSVDSLLGIVPNNFTTLTTCTDNYEPEPVAEIDLPFRLTYIRIKHNLSPGVVSKALKISLSRYVSLESKRSQHQPRYQILANIAYCYNITVEDLLGLSHQEIIKDQPFFEKKGMKKVLGHNLRNIRLQNNFSQEHVAKLFNVDRSSYTNYELGKVAPTLYGLVTFAKTFGVETDSLLGLKSNRQ